MAQSSKFENSTLSIDMVLLLVWKENEKLALWFYKLALYIVKWHTFQLNDKIQVRFWKKGSGWELFTTYL